MSDENVEIVRRMIAAFVEDDYERLVELFDPQVEYDVSRTSPDGRVAHGHEELAEVIEQWLATWDDHRLELVELIDAGDERVVALMRERGKMKGSDTWVEHQVGVLFTLRDGRITRYEEYQDKAGALEAAGLSEYPLWTKSSSGARGELTPPSACHRNSPAARNSSPLLPL